MVTGARAVESRRPHDMTVGYSSAAPRRSSADLKDNLDLGSALCSIRGNRAKQPPQRSRTDPLAGNIADEVTLRVDGLMLTGELVRSDAIKEL